MRLSDFPCTICHDFGSAECDCVPDPYSEIARLIDQLHQAVEEILLAGGTPVFEFSELMDQGTRAHVAMCRNLEITRTLVGDLVAALDAATADRDRLREALTAGLAAWASVDGLAHRQGDRVVSAWAQYVDLYDAMNRLRAALAGGEA